MEDSYRETFDTWNKVAKLYEDRFMHLDIYNDSYDAFCKAIPGTNASILEIGCGPGNITKYLLTKRPDFKITGIDIAPNMIELAKLNNPSANFEVMDGRELEKIEAKFDGIVCGFCIPYLSAHDCTKLIKDCSHLLLPNGALHLSFVEGDYHQSGYQTASSGDRAYFYYHTVKEFQKELGRNDFKMVDLMTQKYTRSDGTEDLQSIMIATK